MTQFLSLLIGLAVILGVWGVYSLLMDLFLRDQTRVEERMRAEFRSKQRERAKKNPLFKDLGKLAAEIRGNDPSFMERLQVSLEQAGFENFSAAKLLVICAFVGILVGAIIQVAFGQVLYTTPAVMIALYLPIAIVNRMKAMRLEALRVQLPDTFDMMARVIRSGQTMEQAMQSVTDEFMPPIAVEFALCSEMINLGIPPELSLQDLARRSGVMELKIFVMGLLIQRETGGNLAELLDNLAAVVRERFRINGQIATLTAEGRMQAMVLLALPPGMLCIMLVLNPKYAQTLIDRPIMIIAMLISEGIGALWIRQIVNFDF